MDRRGAYVQLYQSGCTNAKTSSAGLILSLDNFVMSSHFQASAYIESNRKRSGETIFASANDSIYTSDTSIDYIAEIVPDPNQQDRFKFVRQISARHNINLLMYDASYELDDLILTHSIDYPNEHLAKCDAIQGYGLPIKGDVQ